MTPLERAVIETIAVHNNAQRDEAPYPWSLLPMAQAVIEVVGMTEHSPEGARVPLRCKVLGHRWHGVWLFTPNVIVQRCSRCAVTTGPQR